MNNQAVNPFLPSWEFIPDGEPYVFGDRVYIYGSHDQFNGYVFCMNDYVCWSAPADNLADWRYEGVIWKKTDEPLNADGHMCLYAPDVTRGSDGRYYLYYVMDKLNIVSVAVCDTPAGKYQFLGYVKYQCGTRLGERAGDEPQFDPGVLTEGNKTYLYTGFCGHGDKSRSGAWGMVLDTDMCTIIEEPVLVVPGNCYGAGTDFEGHEYFEAASIRKHGDTYYFVYSATPMHILCYATSKHPLKDFKYGGVLVSNCDIGIDTYKPADKPMNFAHANNHGSIIEINGQWYVFYHRHTNGTWFSRQACMERITMAPDGSFAQVEMTSLGASATPLPGLGEYPTYIACNLFTTNDAAELPKISQDGKNGDEEVGFVTNLKDGAGVGFKYFACEGITRVAVKTRAYNRGTLEVRTAWDGPALGCIPIVSANIWTEFAADITIPDGVHALYFVYKGTGAVMFGAFALERG
ncbi:MAG: family 43 glycosylhydrolase [Defluviitaleaceae bacterium]|nr:family 43 glycosylhydrolase [Defluviitaleaceae bacterium]